MTVASSFAARPLADASTSLVGCIADSRRHWAGTKIEDGFDKLFHLSERACAVGTGEITPFEEAHEIAIKKIDCQNTRCARTHQRAPGLWEEAGIFFGELRDRGIAHRTKLRSAITGFLSDGSPAVAAVSLLKDIADDPVGLGSELLSVGGAPSIGFCRGLGMFEYPAGEIDGRVFKEGKWLSREEAKDHCGPILRMEYTPVFPDLDTRNQVQRLFTGGAPQATCMFYSAKDGNPEYFMGTPSLLAGPEPSWATDVSIPIPFGLPFAPGKVHFFAATFTSGLHPVEKPARVIREAGKAEGYGAAICKAQVSETEAPLIAEILESRSAWINLSFQSSSAQIDSVAC